jgi:hypothetical protein
VEPIGTTERARRIHLVHGGVIHVVVVVVVQGSIRGHVARSAARMMMEALTSCAVGVGRSDCCDCCGHCCAWLALLELREALLARHLKKRDMKENDEKFKKKWCVRG